MKNAIFVMLHRVVLVTNEGPEERIASSIRVRRIGELGATLAVTNNRKRCEEIL
jgi:hypothetical protein